MMKVVGYEGVLTIIFALVIAQHGQVSHIQGHHLPQGQAVGEDVGLVRDLPFLLQRLHGLPGLRAHVRCLGVGHWRGSGEGEGGTDGKEEQGSQGKFVTVHLMLFLWQGEGVRAVGRESHGEGKGDVCKVNQTQHGPRQFPWIKGEGGIEKKDDKCKGERFTR